MIENDTIQSKPFIRWAGGKTGLMKHIVKNLPERFNNYHEPFLGGGALFFHLSSQALIRKAFLNDLNTELINSYKQIKKDPEIIISQLSRYKNNSPSYYKERELIPTDKTKLASRFLYLNRTGFNGIYRVNRQGVYNVPYGNKKYKCLFDYENIRNVSKALNQASLTSKDFYKTLAEIDENDLVFIDPPYTVSHENNGFVKYNQKIFIWKDQERLLKFIKRIEQKKAFFIMTNAAHPSIKKLFKPIGTPKKIERCSVIGGTKAFRGIVHEYLYTNIK